MVTLRRTKAKLHGIITIKRQIPPINVSKGVNDNNQVFDGKVRKKEVEVLESDIRYIKKDFTTSNSKDSSKT